LARSELLPTKEALIACCDRFCGPIDPAAVVALAALPPSIDSAPPPVAAVRSVTPGIVAPRKVLARALPEPRGRRPLTQMQIAYLEAAKRRVARDLGGRVMLPTGAVEAGELAQVLGAIERARR
jgi:hypothetical protein